jgi:histidinol-phosphatase (PHP family)
MFHPTFAEQNTFMPLANFHTHSSYCDGTSAPEEFVKAAIDMGFDSIGFSSHAPVPFQNRWSIKPDRLSEYLEDIRALKTKYKSKINIFLSLEIDYIPDLTSNMKELCNECKLDYTIGGVHLVKSEKTDKLWFIDGSPDGYDNGLRDIFKMDIQKGVRCYFEQLWEMIFLQKPDVIAHADKIKMNNRGLYFSTDEKWYQDFIAKTIKVIAESKLIVEVNTRGIYKKRCPELYPSVEMLEAFHKLKVPIMLSSDAHDPSELALQFPETIKVLMDMGFRESCVYTEQGWKFRKLSDF